MQARSDADEAAGSTNPPSAEAQKIVNPSMAEVIAGH
jgi:hypothetical protein